MMRMSLYQGDALNALKLIETDSIDAIVSDPPYQLSSTRVYAKGTKIDEISEQLTENVEENTAYGSLIKGFMNKEWDVLPSVETLKECLRVLKAGAFALWLMTPRQDSQLEFLLRLRQAGFVIAFTPLYWAYASGFPKALNIGKAIKKKGLEKEAQKFNGSYGGFQPKPAVEAIIVSMKPLNEKTYVKQALKNGKGITWLDDVRIPFMNYSEVNLATEGAKRFQNHSSIFLGQDNKASYNPKYGRFPANLLVSDNVLDNGIINKSPSGNVNRKLREGNVFTSKTSGFDSENNHTSRVGDSGQFSRYFSLDAWWEAKLKELPEEIRATMPFMEVPKASKSERNRNLNYNPIDNSDEYNGKFPNSKADKESNNKHPTVKPLALISYLITLTTRQGDKILDPFVGSGTTMVSAKMLSRNATGIEREQEYIEIAKRRLLWGSGFGNIEWIFKEV